MRFNSRRRPPARVASRCLLWVLAFSLLVAQGCALDFSGDRFQRLRFFIRLSRTLDAGDASLVHTWFFPDALKLKKRYARISGLAEAPPGGALPGRVLVMARFEDAASGRAGGKLSIPVVLAADGSFSASKRLTKNARAGSVLMVTIEPVGSRLARNTELTLCVDVVEKKADLSSLPGCHEGAGGGQAVTLSRLETRAQDN